MTPAPDLADLAIAPVARSSVSSEHARLIAATFDAAPRLESGLPLLWHWAYFNAIVPSASLGPDGHPRRGTAVADRPRRMWVGGSVYWSAPLLVDREAIRTSRLERAEHKDGRSGPMWLITVSHAVTQDGVLVLTEEQDLALREPARVGPEPVPPSAFPGGTPDAPWIEELAVSPAMLLRYSAITFNAHRIHYDRRYATMVEGYDDVVVHGPLLVTKLAELGRRHLEGDVASLRYRLTAPVFVDERCWLVGRPNDEGAELAVVRGDGSTACTMSVAVVPPDRAMVTR